jgi:hypothetical protein
MENKEKNLEEEKKSNIIKFAFIGLFILGINSILTGLYASLSSGLGVGMIMAGIWLFVAEKLKIIKISFN